MTARQARLAYLIANSHYIDCVIRDTRQCEQWLISPCISAETQRAHYLATNLWLRYKRLLTEERAARKARRQVRRRLMVEEVSA